MKKRASPNFDERPSDLSIDMLVFHYTGMPTMDVAMDRLCDPSAEVSAHYLVEEDGTVWALVDEDKRAWHAGVAQWRGETNVNARSIGIEIVNPGHEFGYCAFPEAQIEAVRNLAKEILERHPVPARNVVGHSDVAPTRKSDPGEFFPWADLAAEGIGMWPTESDHLEQDSQVLATALNEIGYAVSDYAAALKAFQRHFRPTRVTGRSDAETARRIIGLNAMLKIDER